MKIQTKPYNPVDFFQNNEEIVAYLNDAFMDDDADMFIIALSHVIKKKGITAFALETGLKRENLSRVLSGKSQPKWNTVQKIIRSLNMNIRLAV